MVTKNRTMCVDVGSSSQAVCIFRYKRSFSAIFQLYQKIYIFISHHLCKYTIKKFAMFISSVLLFAVVSLSATSWAYKVTLENKSCNSIYFYVESLSGGERYDSGGLISPDDYRVYEPGNIWLSDVRCMDVKEGDVRTASIYNEAFGMHEFANCGSITFKGATHIIYKDGVCIPVSHFHNYYYWLLMFAHAL